MIFPFPFPFHPLTEYPVPRNLGRGAGGFWVCAGEGIRTDTL